MNAQPEVKTLFLVILVSGKLDILTCMERGTQAFKVFGVCFDATHASNTREIACITSLISTVVIKNDAFTVQAVEHAQIDRLYELGRST